MVEKFAGEPDLREAFEDHFAFISKAGSPRDVFCGRLAVFFDVRSDVAVYAVRKVELSGPLRESEAGPVAPAVDADPVVDGRPAERRRGRDQHQVRRADILPDQGFRAFVLLAERVSDFVAANEHRHELSPQQQGIRRDRAETIGVHDVIQLPRFVFLIPSDPAVARLQGVNGISQTEQADQSAVVFVEYEKPEPSSVSRGDRNAPVEGCVPEKQFVLRAGMHLDEPGTHGSGVHLVSVGDVADQPAFVPANSGSRRLHLLLDRKRIQRAHVVLRRIFGHSDKAVPYRVSLLAQRLNDSGLQAFRGWRIHSDT